MSHLVEFGEGRHRVWLDLISAGDDFVVYIGGGDKPHMGSISVCPNSGSPFTISLIKHKDYIISHRAAQTIFKETGRKTAVIAGIHIENASKEDIDILIKNAEECVQIFVKKMI